MKTSIGTWLSALALLGMTIPVSAADGEVHAAAKPTVTDLALSAKGAFSGVVVDATGRPKVNSPVHVIHARKVVASANTDRNGKYTISGLRSGIHTIRLADGETICRFWSDGSAPPRAKKNLVLVDGTTIVRGNDSPGISANALIGGALVVTATTAVIITTAGDNTVNLTPPPASP